MRRLWPHIVADSALDPLASAFFPALASDMRLAVGAGLILIQLAILWQPVTQWAESILNPAAEDSTSSDSQYQ